MELIELKVVADICGRWLVLVLLHSNPVETPLGPVVLCVLKGSLEKLNSTAAFRNPADAPLCLLALRAGLSSAGWVSASPFVALSFVPCLREFSNRVALDSFRPLIVTGFGSATLLPRLRYFSAPSGSPTSTSSVFVNPAEAPGRA